MQNPLSPAFVPMAESPVDAILRSNTGNAGADDDTEKGFDPMHKPIPEISLRWQRFVLLMVGISAIIIVVSCVFVIGVPVDHINETIGESDKTDARVSLYNTYSGVIMGIFETFIGMGFASSFPVFTVYVHNLKWFPGDNPAEKISKVKKIGSLLFFPLMMVIIGSSFTALQAGSTTTGYSLTMTEANLKQNSTTNTTSVIEHLSLPYDIQSLDDTILKTAIQRKATSFKRVASQCTRDATKYDDTKPGFKSISDVDSTSMSFSFPVKSWGTEMYPLEENFIEDPTLDVDTAFQLLFHGQAFVERSIADATANSYCDESNSSSGSNSTECTYNVFTYLSQLYGYLNGTYEANESNLQRETFSALNTVFDNELDEDTLEFSYNAFPFGQQLSLKTLTIAVAYNASREYGRSGETEKVDCDDSGENCNYVYKFTQQDTFCGSLSCIFLDWNGDSFPRRQAMMTQFMSNCSADSITYNENLNTFIPENCEVEENAAFIYGFGTTIVADEIGTNYTSNTTGSTTPYVMNPRRYLVYSFSKLSWDFRSMAEDFGTKCESDIGCIGLQHYLRTSNRYILLGRSAFPKGFSSANFERPIELYKLNSLKVEPVSGDGSKAAVIELLSTKGMVNKWPTDGLAGNNCSALVDSYIHHVSVNHYYGALPLQSSYTAALLYLFQHAVLLNTISNTKVIGKGGLIFGFQGNTEISDIYVKNTTVGAVALWIGCGIILILTILAIAVPNERARLGPPMGNNARAERFVAVQTEEAYPNLVYKKRFVLGKTSEEVKFREFVVESVVLHHVMDEEEQVYI